MKRRTQRPIPPMPLIRVIALDTCRDPEGEPRVALEITPPASAINRRAIVRTFGSLTAALAVKRDIEGGGNV